MQAHDPWAVPRQGELLASNRNKTTSGRRLHRLIVEAIRTSWNCASWWKRNLEPLTKRVFLQKAEANKSKGDVEKGELDFLGLFRHQAQLAKAV